MNLAFLEPRWIRAADAPADSKQGISFLCPHCKTIRLAVFFDVPILGPEVDLKAAHRAQAELGHLGDCHLGAVLWHRAGETFETLTLSPSIDASHFGHWHGFITNGIAT